MNSSETALAKNNSRAAHGEELLQLVSFNVAEEEYGLQILKVQEIIRMQGLTRVPIRRLSSKASSTCAAR